MHLCMIFDYINELCRIQYVFAPFQNYFFDCSKHRAFIPCRSTPNVTVRVNRCVNNIILDHDSCNSYFCPGKDIIFDSSDAPTFIAPYSIYIPNKSIYYIYVTLCLKLFACHPCNKSTR